MSGALIDMLERIVTLRVVGEKVTLDVLKWNNQVNAWTEPPQNHHLADPFRPPFDDFYDHHVEKQANHCVSQENMRCK